MNLQEMAQAIRRDNLPPINIPIRDSIHTARGYRMIDEVWTCVPDAVYPWSADALRLIRTFAPDTVPLWRLSVFFAPNTQNIVVFGRHALGRHIDRPGYDLTPLPVLMPTMPCLGVTFPRPNKVWFVHEGNRNPDYPDIPGAYLPFDDSIVHKARWSCEGLQNLTDREFKQQLHKELIDDAVEAQQKRRAALADDWAQRDKDFAPYAQKLIDRVSDVEIDEWMSSIGKREREKKIMVQVGDSPRGDK